MKKNDIQYGTGDHSYQTAGELAGIVQLVDSFFDFMDELEEAKIVRAIYPRDLAVSRKKLAYFLSGWLGGPRIYAEHYGEISIPAAHRHLNISRETSDAWLLCMERAAQQQAYADSFKVYLIEQLSIPANRIVSVCNA